MEKEKIIAVDFDGTCVTHAFPKVGKDIGAAPVLKRLVALGYKIILFTMRGDEQVHRITSSSEIEVFYVLKDAVAWFKENGIPLYGINANPTQKNWSKSPKVFAHYYIDDMAVGCPLIYDATLSDRPFVDWEAIAEFFNVPYKKL